MAIIVDTNCFSRVFCRSNKEHADFAPVLDWVVSGNGFLVYGGSKYKQELKNARKFIPFLKLLKNYKKLCLFDDALIDELQMKYEQMIQDPDFDDPHLPAIVMVSKCRLICSLDYRSIPFVTSPGMYPKHFHVPRYYSGAKDRWLLIDANIDPRLQKYRGRLNKQQKESIFKFSESL